MGDAGDFEPEPVQAIRIAMGAIAAGPAGKRHERAGVLGGIGRRGEKARADGARVGEGLASEEALAFAPRIDGGEQETALLVADQREGQVIRCGLGFERRSLPLQPFQRQKRQPHGNHTTHHSTPRSNFPRAPRPDSARA